MGTFASIDRDGQVVFKAEGLRRIAQGIASVDPDEAQRILWAIVDLADDEDVPGELLRERLGEDAAATAEDVVTGRGGWRHVLPGQTVEVVTIENGDEWPGGLSDGLTLECTDCGRVPGLDYTVTDDEWKRIGPGPNVLCIECFLERGGSLSAVVKMHLVQRQASETLELEPTRLWRY